MSCPDCTKGVILKGEPNGRIDPSTGAYIASGPEGNTSRAIILLTDIYGLGLRNPELLADNFAKRLGCDVYVPDIFAGKPPVVPGDLKGPRRVGERVSMLNMLWSALPHLPAIFRNRSSVVDPRVKKFIENLQSGKKYTKLGAIGYCFGGSMCIRFASSGLLDTIVVCHPGNPSQKELDAISIPSCWMCAEDDLTFGRENRARAEKSLVSRRGKDNFTEYQFRDYKGTVHGFASRPNLDIPEVKEAFEQAFEHAVEWFNNYQQLIQSNQLQLNVSLFYKTSWLVAKAPKSPQRLIFLSWKLIIMLTVPPGIEALIRDILPKVFKLPALSFLLLKLAQKCGVNLPDWAWMVTLISVHPIAWLGTTFYNQHRQRREAAAKGAILVPRVKGSSFQLKKKMGAGYVCEEFFEWGKEYGQTYVLPMFGTETLMTMEPEHIKAMLATQFDDFYKGEVIVDHFNSLLGSGVFNSDGDMWKFHRGMTRPFFSKIRTSDYDVFERHAEETLSVLGERLASGHPVDFQDAITRFTLDSATSFLFGKSVDTISGGLPYPPTSPLSSPLSFLNHPSTKFATALTQSLEIIIQRSTIGKHWRLFEFWRDKVQRHRRDLEEFINPILDEVVEGSRKDGNIDDNLKEGVEETFLEHLVKFTEDRKVVTDEVLNILLAARDTTASLLTSCVYILTQRPDICARLKSEISEKLGSSRRLTYEDTKKMKYLRAFLNETLRLYPPLPVDFRSPRHDTTLPNKNGKPWYIPKGTTCFYVLFLMHRREDLWGPDALEFDPDRFLDERLHKYLVPNPFIFLPFNAGPRICLGQQFAYNEASYFLIKLLQKFEDFTLALDVQPSQPPAEWKPEPGTTKGRDKVMMFSKVTLAVKDGLWIRMKSVNETFQDGQE
ncbi:cytochrome P450 [Dendrothele bispora CBS 962.96]|uniref:Cytochrome P450 n=1 Tax=Dendrothele bispora (strain CBS 962.96) TaxID=1314807 RepID=A0A4S8MFJ6_DENBC|nr:cytochrome P450 [Dendrothele bispora CBS 962.96]